jgi:hypothetical protein
MLRDNLIANNSGNLLFLETAWKILSTKGHEITADRLSAHRLGADRINERFDAYVIPLANAFPAVVYGQPHPPHPRHRAIDDPGDRPRRRGPVRAVARARRGPPVRRRGHGIREGGSSTGRRRSAFVARPPRRYLRELGFRDVEVIGCPRCSSMASTWR